MLLSKNRLEMLKLRGPIATVTLLITIVLLNNTYRSRSFEAASGFTLE